MRLYPQVTVKGKSFVGVKKHVVPMQSMSLREILRRFVRKESLPISHEGTYNDSYDYDLEKLAKEDMTVQQEVLAEVKAKAAALDKEVKKQEAEKKDAMSKARAAKKAKLMEEFTAQANQAKAANSQGGKP